VYKRVSYTYYYVLYELEGMHSPCTFVLMDAFNKRQPF
jgi:hypothetical protein